MQNAVSGFKVEGTWEDVVDHGERITRALIQAGLGTAEASDELEEALDEWEAWRPKTHDSFDDDIREKTADQASLSEGAGEQAGKAPGDDLKEARDKFFRALGDIERKGLREAVSSVGASLGRVGRAADSAGRKAFRSLEDLVYQGVMTKVTPYYFDNELISADLSRKSNGSQPRYSLEVNIQDDRLKNRVARILKNQDDPDYAVADQMPKDKPGTNGR